MALVAIGNGMTQPSAVAAAISVRPMLAGTASGLIGALQMGAGALATVLAGVTEGGAGIATGAWMLAGALGAQVALRAVRRAGGLEDCRIFGRHVAGCLQSITPPGVPPFGDRPAP